MIKLIIEDVDNKKDFSRLISALEKSNNTSYEITDVNRLLQHSDNEECVVVYGSRQFAKCTRWNPNWIPGIWHNKEELEVHRYLTYLADYSIHTKFGFHTIQQLVDDTYDIFHRYNNPATNNGVFIKPNVGYKAFSGNVAKNYEEWKELILNIKPFNNESMLCLISQASDIPIKKEYRFFVTRKRIITGSQYMPHVAPLYVGNSECKWAEIFVEEVRKHYFTKTPSFSEYEYPIVMDVALMEDGYCRLLELGCFNVAGLYNCDYERLVYAINHCAITEYEDIHERV